MRNITVEHFRLLLNENYETTIESMYYEKKENRWV